MWICSQPSGDTIQKPPDWQRELKLVFFGSICHDNVPGSPENPHGFSHIVHSTIFSSSVTRRLCIDVTLQIKGGDKSPRLFVAGGDSGKCSALSNLTGGVMQGAVVKHLLNAQLGPHSSGFVYSCRNLGLGLKGWGEGDGGGPWRYSVRGVGGKWNAVPLTLSNTLSAIFESHVWCWQKILTSYSCFIIIHERVRYTGYDVNPRLRVINLHNDVQIHQSTCPGWMGNHFHMTK